MIPKPELPPLPRSVAEATAECRTLYERYWPELRPRLLAALPPPDGSAVTVAPDPQRPLADTVAQLLAAVDRDGVAVLANAVPLDICDTIMTELSQCKCSRSLCVFFRSSKTRLHRPSKCS